MDQKLYGTIVELRKEVRDARAIGRTITAVQISVLDKAVKFLEELQEISDEKRGQ